MQAIAQKEFLAGLNSFCAKNKRRKAKFYAFMNRGETGCDANYRLNRMLLVVKDPEIPASIRSQQHKWPGWEAAGYKQIKGCGSSNCSCGLNRLVP